MSVWVAHEWLHVGSFAARFPHRMNPETRPVRRSNNPEVSDPTSFVQNYCYDRLLDHSHQLEYVWDRFHVVYRIHLKRISFATELSSD